MLTNAIELPCLAASISVQTYGISKQQEGSEKAEGS